MESFRQVLTKKHNIWLYNTLKKKKRKKEKELNMVENSKGRERPNFVQARIFGCSSVVREERSLSTSTNNQRVCLKAYGVGECTEGNKIWKVKKW